MPPWLETKKDKGIKKLVAQPKSVIRHARMCGQKYFAKIIDIWAG
jgi:hypothetical protein